MRHGLLGNLIALSCSLCAGQGLIAQSVILVHDSLEQELEQASTDEARIDLHLQLAMVYFDMMENDRTMEHLNMGVELANTRHDRRGQAYAPLVQGVADLSAHRYRPALAAFEECIRRLDGLNVRQGFLSPLGQVRQIFNEAGWQDERLTFYVDKLNYYREHGPAENEGACYHGIGGYYFSAGEPDKAIDNYLRAREVWARFDPIGHANQPWPISIMYQKWGNWEKAEEYALLAVKENEQVGLLTNLMAAYGGLQQLHLAMGDTASALMDSDRGRPYWKRCTPLLLASHLLSLVNIHLARGDLDEAGHYLAMADSLDGVRDLYLYSTKGEIELDYIHSLYLRARGDQLGADARLEDALRTAIDQDVTQYAQKYRKLLAERYGATGRTAEAYGMLAAYVHLDDSLQKHADKRRVAGYEVELKERELVEERQRQDEQLRLQRSLMIASIGAAFLFATLVLFVIRSNRQKQRANKELDAARLRAEASEKFKQQFLANMSHEIRTPMNAIMGMTGILKRNERLPEQEKYLSAISQSSENLLVILNDILDLSKLEAGKIDLEKVAFDPRQVVGNVRDILRFKAEEKGIALMVNIAEDTPALLLGDPTRLNQIVLNLAGNAIKFTEHGSVTIAAHWADGALYVSVTDTGIGIPEDRLEKIFEEFTQAYSDTTRKYGGTGLGLTISKRLAELQGGSIAVHSEQGKGSTFIVTIPYTIATSGREVTERAPVGGTAELRDLKILLAEDNDFNAMVAQDELADAIPGVQVDVAANGRIAVEMVQANDYDMVLMDVQMPEMNGYDATKAIRALSGDRSRIPIVAMTANVMKEEVERCTEAGMDGYVPKPFKREELMDAIGVAMAKG